MPLVPYEWPKWFDLLDEGVAFFDKSGHFIRVNDSFVELVGYSHSELLNKSFKLITHPDDVESNTKEMEKVLNNETEHYSLLKRYITKFGDSIWVKVIVHPIKNQDDKIEHFFKQVVTIKNGAREQIKKVNHDIQVIETLSVDSFIRKNWWRLTQICTIIIATMCGWVVNATLKMYADSNRIDRLERKIEDEKSNLPNKPN